VIFPEIATGKRKNLGVAFDPAAFSNVRTTSGGHLPSSGLSYIARLMPAPEPVHPGVVLRERFLEPLGLMCKRPNIDPNVLAALESSGVERVKLELLSPPRVNVFTFCGVQVTRGHALDWLNWKACKDARFNRVVALIAMIAAIAAAIFSFPSFWRAGN
jgi:hypothetical protein